MVRDLPFIAREMIRPANMVAELLCAIQVSFRFDSQARSIWIQVRVSSSA